MNYLKKVWGFPLVLAVLTLFGLLAALLGTGMWYPAAWAALLIPFVTISWYWLKATP